MARRNAGEESGTAVKITGDWLTEKNAMPLVEALLYILCDGDVQHKLGMMTKQINPMIQKAIRDYNNSGKGD